jgi:hypothetical protein
MKLHVAGHSVPNPSRMPSIMGLTAPESSASPALRDPERRQVKGDAARHRCASRFALSVVSDRRDALFTLIAAARGMRLPRAATLEPLRVS